MPKSPFSQKRPSVTAARQGFWAVRYAFGSGMAARTASFGSNYRYGMNTQEKETELGEGVTSAEYWFYDGKLGRRWNVDPVIDCDYSSYSIFNDNPVIFIDPFGDKLKPTMESGQPVIRATIYIRFDPGLSLTPAQKTTYISNLGKNISGVWSIQKYQGKAVVLDLDIVEYAGSKVYGKKDTKLTDSKNTIIIDVGNWDPTSKNRLGISHSDLKGSYGWFNYGYLGTEGAHEFGHFLGLRDRYAEGATYDNDHNPKTNTNTQDQLLDRQTIPIVLPERYDNQYQPFDNLMSDGSQVTQKQMKIVFRRKHERKLVPTNIVVLLSNNLSTNPMAVRVHTSYMGISISGCNYKMESGRWVKEIASGNSPTFFGSILGGFIFYSNDRDQRKRFLNHRYSRFDDVKANRELLKDILYK